MKQRTHSCRVLTEILLASCLALTFPRTALGISDRCIRFLVSLVKLGEDYRRVTGRPSQLHQKIMLRSETQIKTVTEDYTGQSFVIKRNGVELPVTIGKKYGDGAIGVVHAISIEPSPEALSAFPEFFQDGKPRTDLVAKLPLALADPVDRERVRQAVIDEAVETQRLNERLKQLGFSPIVGTEVLHLELGSPPILIKRAIDTRQLQTVVEIAKAGGLTDEQREALRTQFYPKISALHYSGLNVDLRAENLFWDPQRKEWGMFELTQLRLNDNMFERRGFNGYLFYYEGAIRYYREHPSSDAAHDAS